MAGVRGGLTPSQHERPRILVSTVRRPPSVLGRAPRPSLPRWARTLVAVHMNITVRWWVSALYQRDVVRQAKGANHAGKPRAHHDTRFTRSVRGILQSRAKFRRRVQSAGVRTRLPGKGDSWRRGSGYAATLLRHWGVASNCPTSSTSSPRGREVLGGQARHGVAPVAHCAAPSSLHSASGCPATGAGEGPAGEGLP